MVSGQKLCEILTPALLAAQHFLSFQNKKFIRLTAFLATVLINRHIFSFMFANANTLFARALIFLSHEALFSARIRPDELGRHCL